jgi:hypothetical protein
MGKPREKKKSVKDVDDIEELDPVIFLLLSVLLIIL